MLQVSLPVVGGAAQACFRLHHSLLLLKDRSGADMLPESIGRKMSDAHAAYH